MEDALPVNMGLLKDLSSDIFSGAVLQVFPDYSLIWL